MRVTPALVAMVLMSPGALLSATTSTDRNFSNHELRAQKHGRIVDADSGAGIPDVKIVVNWRMSSTGISGLRSGGTWCNLQKIVTTDENGNYTIPDVSKELDLSDRGANSTLTPLGVLTATHDPDWRLGTFKDGYLRVGEEEQLKQRLAVERDGFIASSSFQFTPEVEGVGIGKIAIKPIALRKVDLKPEERWSYLLRVFRDDLCRDRLGKEISQPQLSQIEHDTGIALRSAPCRFSPEIPVSSAALDAFGLLIHDRDYSKPFYDRIKQLQGMPTSRWSVPGEQINTTMGVLCRATSDERGGS